MSTPTAPRQRRSLRDLSVGVKITAAVGVVAVVALLVGVLGILQVRGLADAQNRMYEQRVSPMLELARAQHLFQGTRLTASTMGLRPHQTDEVLEELDVREAETVEMLEGYREYALDAADVDESIASVREYHAQARGAWADVVRTGDVDAQLATYLETLGPVGVAAGEQMEAGLAQQAELADGDNDTAVEQAASTQVFLVVVLVVGLVAGLAVALLVVRQIMRTVAAVQTAVTALGEGDLTTLPDVDTGDELGRMAQDLGRSITQLRTTVGAVTEAAQTVASGAEELAAATTQTASGAEEASAQSGVVASAAEQVSQSIQTVAAGAEQMGASIREIAQNSTEAAKVAGEATEQAAATNETVAKLGASSAEIGNVIKVITTVAEQTNLLALNATIEAARAGEAGKGFAVVASEVKELAQETAKASEDISRRIEAIQEDTTGAVAAIGDISQIIARINDYQMTIASAVEEQTATTNEMSRSVAEAASGSGEIARNIAAIADTARNDSGTMVQMQSAVSELAQVSEGLRSQVAQFRL